jgi:uncharacterized protein YcfJ
MKIKILATATGLAALASFGLPAEAQLVPSVAAMPGPNKSYPAFQQDDAVCQQYANGQVAAMQNQAAGQVVGGAVLGSLLGAGLGAAVGGGRGAAIGAGTGAAVGTGVGAANAQQTEYAAQQRFDTLYQQCMDSRGNVVPSANAPGN